VAAEAAEAAVAGKARLFALLALFAGGTALGAGATLTTADLAGRYTRTFRTGLVSGENYMATDVVTVVATSRTRALVNFDLTFFNGHICSLTGIARLEGRALVYRRPGRFAGDPPCILRLWRQGARLRWNADNNSCREDCGARGSFTDGGMRWSSRRPISRAGRARILRDFERIRNLP